MDQRERWSDQLLEVEAKIGEAYDILSVLHSEIKEAGRKKDVQALGEVVERLARYGRLFQDMRETWADPES